MLLALLTACAPTTTPGAHSSDKASACDATLTATATASAHADQPYSQRLDLSLSAAEGVDVVCTSPDDAEERLVLPTSPSAETHELWVHGLLADTAYDCEVQSACDGAVLQTVSFTTGAEPSWIPTMVVTTDATLEMTGAYTAFNTNRSCAGDGQARVIVVDPEGRPRWVYDDFSRALNIGIEVEYFGNGLWVFGGGHAGLGAPWTVDMAWDRVDVMPDLGYTYHHHAERLPDGNYFGLAMALNAQGPWTWWGFRLVDYDPDTGSVDWEWNSQAGYAQGALPSGSGDVYHANWATRISESTGDAVYVSLCSYQKIIRIDPATDLVTWVFGNGGDFSLVDTAGNPLASGQWPSCQHGVDVQEGRLLVYDNGWARGKTRLAEYSLDTSTMTATLEWSYGEGSWYEPIWGDADRLSDDRVLMGMGHASCAGASPSNRSQVLELDVPTATPVWRMTMTDATQTMYRATRVDGCDLFHNTRYCPE